MTRPLYDVIVGGRFRTGLTKRIGKVLTKGEGSILVEWAAHEVVSFTGRNDRQKRVEPRRKETIGCTTQVEWPITPNGGTP